MTEIKDVATAIHTLASTTNVCTSSGTVKITISLDMPDSLDNKTWEFFQDIKTKMGDFLEVSLRGCTLDAQD